MIEYYNTIKRYNRYQFSFCNNSGTDVDYSDRNKYPNNPAKVAYDQQYLFPIV